MGTFEDFIKTVNEPLNPKLISDVEVYDPGAKFGPKKRVERYLKGYVIVKLLNKATKGDWNFIIEKVWNEKIPHTKKKGDQIIDQMNDVHYMLGTLEINLYDDKGNSHVIKKQAIGGKVRFTDAKNAESIYKSLATITLRKAASYTGIGAELWLDEDENDILSEDMQEPLWNDELLQKYAPEWSRIDEIITAAKFSDEDLPVVISGWDPNIDDIEKIPPERIKDFADWLKKLVDSADEENEVA